jgi:disulfide bond formation protein DsbB
MMLNQLSRRDWLTLVGGGALALVAGGVVLAKTMNLAACPLCILQRMLYLTLLLEAMLAWPLANRGAGRIASLLMACTAATGVYFAGYQTWLQRFAGNVSCTADQPWWEQMVYWAGAKVPLLFEATGLCSEAGWKFLGLSIAEWSLLIFSAMTAICLLAARKRKTRSL